MASIRTLPGMNDSGFDADRALLVLPANRTATLYLVEGGSDALTPSIEDETVATVAEGAALSAKQKKGTELAPAEKTADVHKMTVKGLKVGTTTLRARPAAGGDVVAPVTVRVTADADYRQAGDKGSLTPELRRELQALDLRAAVLRVAEDQMNSRIGRATDGFGRYVDDASYDWCGAFAHWCWAAACAAKGVANPFGDRSNVLLSAQKAVSWALQTGGATILRYEGGDPYGNSFTTGKPLGKAAKTQTYIEIGPDNPVLPADIVILRNETSWQHVCMVWETPTGADLETIDGNQGTKGTTAASIKRRTRSMTAKVNKGKDFALVFLHVDV